MDYMKVAESWLSPFFDSDTRKEVSDMMEHDPQKLEDAFYKRLEFGTGGLRGIMGAGTNRMNRYTVAMATQGFSEYLKENAGGGRERLSVAISYDSRNNSRQFAQVAASVFAANGIDAFLFDDMRPTPELSFAIRYLKCDAGVMITASHNPKEYNGYKAFWSDGGQVVPPHDKGIISKVAMISSPAEVKFEGGTGKIAIIGKEVDEAYLSAVSSLLMSPESVARHGGMKIVYSPLHGTGIKLVPEALERNGFRNVACQKEQSVPDGNFPTVKSPNPEEHSALELSLELADETGADIVLATDPDADRVGVAVRNDEGKMVLLNGNQTASLLVYYLLSRRKEKNMLDDKCYIVKTIVTTELISEIARDFGVRTYDVLTGFKYIAEEVRKREGREVFICGGEESYGFNTGEFVRDKDAVSTCCLVAECAAWAADSGTSLYGLLCRIYQKYGYYKESLVSIVKKGKDGLEEIGRMMSSLRKSPFSEICGFPVAKVVDYKDSLSTGLPESDVLRFFCSNGMTVSARPSGTEPKIKFYFGVKGSSCDDASCLLEKAEKHVLENLP